MSMFCYQCEQTAKGTGCTIAGVCGKDPRTAALQDLLIYALKGVAMYAHRARELGGEDGEINRFTAKALFTTVTNVNFDPERVANLVRKCAEMRDRAKEVRRDA
jgi:hydroxylamine reductase